MSPRVRVKAIAQEETARVEEEQVWVIRGPPASYREMGSFMTWFDKIVGQYHLLERMKTVKVLI